jgi:hypothetical protein
MRVVPLESVPVERLEQPRNGVFLFQRLLEGVEGSKSNFSLELVKTFSDFFSPRHRHNFDQVRFQVEGVYDFDKSGKMTPGMVGYFPEGTAYGPQTSTEDALLLVLQFTGASGASYMSKTQLGRAVTELKQLGEFKNGAYARIDGEGRKHNRDAYEAVWEHVFGGRLEYPAPRYNDPILMQPNHFAWTERADEPGVLEKPLGIFTEHRTEIAFLRIEAGGRHRAAGGRLYFIVAGEGSVGGESWLPRTTIHLAPAEEAIFAARSTTEMLVIGFPSLAAVRQAQEAA